ERPGSVGLIAAEAELAKVRKALQSEGVEFAELGGDDDAEARLDLVPASLAKGLEFDHVVLLEPASIAASEADTVTGLRRLYVCLTRAVTSLQVLHAEPLPAELTGA